MRIRTGFDIAYETTQPTPMILMMSVHPTRMRDVLTPHVLTFDPPVQTREYRDDFGNLCHRIVAPPGRLTVSADFEVYDSAAARSVRARGAADPGAGSAG